MALKWAQRNACHNADGPGRRETIDIYIALTLAIVTGKSLLQCS